MLINYVKVNWLNEYLLKYKILICEDIKTHKSCFLLYCQRSVKEYISRNLFSYQRSPKYTIF